MEPTIAVWRTAVSNRSGEDGFIFYRAQNTDRMEFWMKGPSGTGNWNAQVGPNVTDFDQWYHVVGTYDDATQEKKFYFHGENDSWGTSILTTTSAGAYHVVTDQLGIGARGASGALPWGGGTSAQWIDDVQFYNEALGEDDVRSLFENPGRALVPEPSALVLLILGLCWLRRTRR